MTAPVEQIDVLASAPAGSRAFVRTLALGGGGLFLLALGLWAQYGTVVFMETMANAWAYCF